jgi:hypothetical protein
MESYGIFVVALIAVIFYAFFARAQRQNRHLRQKLATLKASLEATNKQLLFVSQELLQDPEIAPKIAITEEEIQNLSIQESDSSYDIGLKIVKLLAAIAKQSNTTVYEMITYKNYTLYEPITNFPVKIKKSDKYNRIKFIYDQRVIFVGIPAFGSPEPFCDVYVDDRFLYGKHTYPYFKNAHELIMHNLIDGLYKIY